jgi:hypothetical protein
MRGGGSGGGGGGAAAGGAAAAGGGGAAPITRDALGGDVFASVYAALMLRLPGQLGDLGAHGHVFANGGSAALLPAAAAAAAGGGGGSSSGSGLAALGRRLREGASQMGASFRWSAGV